LGCPIRFRIGIIAFLAMSGSVVLPGNALSERPWQGPCRDNRFLYAGDLPYAYLEVTSRSFDPAGPLRVFAKSVSMRL
jgi:hypothetical protein